MTTRSFEDQTMNRCRTKDQQKLPLVTQSYSTIIFCDIDMVLQKHVTMSEFLSFLLQFCLESHNTVLT